MKQFKAIPFSQDDVTMYLGSMRAADLIELGEVAVWKEDEKGGASGYQRAPERGRVLKVARYLEKSRQPLMPTSILLSYRGAKLKTKALGDGFVSVTLSEADTFWIVDGQHRVYGLREVIEGGGNDKFKDYSLPVVIVEFESEEQEAHQFQIINETMKKVGTELARRLLALRVSRMGTVGRKEVRDAGRMWEAKAVEVLKVLLEEDSPWYGRIQPPNARKGVNHIIRELSFTTSLKPILTQYPFDSWEGKTIGETQINYWKAWEELAKDAFADTDNYVIMKTPGVFSLHYLARDAMRILDRSKENKPPYSVAKFKEILEELGDYTDSEFWKNDNLQGAAMAGSMKGFKLLADEFQSRLLDAGHEL